MSADEDTELRDLVAQSLESNGVLGKIRAQLRASIFLALEEQDSVQNKTPFLNQSLRQFTNTKEGCLIVGLIREFLTFYNLEFTQAVFEPEVGLPSEQFETRADLAREFNVIESEEASKLPLLVEVMRRGSEASHRSRSSTEDMPVHHVREANRKFKEYDKDGSGTIEKDELRELFCDMFPTFNQNMLDRYVNDEFRASDKDFSNTIDFSEFLDMYKRLFVLCKSSVAQDVANLTLHSPRRMQDMSKAIPHMPAKKTGNSTKDGVKSSGKEVGNGDVGAAKLTKPISPSKDSLNKDSDEDSFFDDPLPSSDRSKGLHRPPPSPKSPRASQIPVPVSGSKAKEVQFKETALSRDHTSLDGLPSLGKMTKVDKDSAKELDLKLADLDMDVHNNFEYDEDFESSNISALGVTPRSARSDHNVKEIEEEVIEEDIEEDLSVAEDLLRSDHSGPDDLTTDRTVSPTDQTSGAFDYMEDVISP